MINIKYFQKFIAIVTSIAMMLTFTPPPLSLHASADHCTHDIRTRTGSTCPTCGQVTSTITYCTKCSYSVTVPISHSHDSDDSGESGGGGGTPGGPPTMYTNTVLADASLGAWIGSAGTTSVSCPSGVSLTIGISTWVSGLRWKYRINSGTWTEVSTDSTTFTTGTGGTVYFELVKLPQTITLSKSTITKTYNQASFSLASSVTVS